VSFWNVSLALLLTALALILRRFSKDAKIQRGDKVLVDLCLELVAAGASVSWLRLLARAWPFGWATRPTASGIMGSVPGNP
jgi:hypothetical protein